MNKKESLLTQHILSYDETDNATRIIQFEHLISLLQEKKLKIPRISSWDDTHENFLFKSSFKIAGQDFGNIFKNFNYEERFFGLCWSYWNETDALWRIYSPNRDRVKIKVSIEKLYIAIVSYCNSLLDNKLLPAIGRIVYISKEDWKIIFSHEFFMDAEGFLTHNIMFVKRMEFEYENEFRTILVSLDPKPGTYFVDIPVDPIDLIDEIVFDPRISDESMKQYSQRLFELGITKFYKSSLYEEVKYEITHNIETLQMPPLKVINYFDRNNALRLCSDFAFEELLKQTVVQIKEQSENK